MLKAAINAKLTKDYENIVIATINKLAEDKVAIAKNSETHFKLYLQATILNGFNFLAFTLVSPVEIKTTSGCTLTFTAPNASFDLKSETDVIESDYSNNNQIGITLVDTDLEDDFIDFVRANDISEISISCKVGKIFKKQVSFKYESVNMDAFNTSMVPKEAEVGEVSNPSAGSNLGI